MVTQADEYNSLRAEVVATQTRRDQIFTFLVTGIVAVFGFSGQLYNPYLPLLAMLLAIFGHLQLAYIDMAVSRPGYHIFAQIESKNAELTWETKSHAFKYSKGHIKASAINVMQLTLFAMGISSIALIALILTSQGETENVTVTCIILALFFVLTWGMQARWLAHVANSEKSFWLTAWDEEQKLSFHAQIVKSTTFHETQKPKSS